MSRSLSPICGICLLADYRLQWERLLGEIDLTPHPGGWRFPSVPTDHEEVST
jgi:hypothetical protein